MILSETKKRKFKCLTKEATQNTVGFRLSGKWSLSAKSTRVFIPSVQKSKEKGFEVDEKGLLRISGFDEGLNLRLTSGLPELFKKISNQFKVSAKMDTTTFIKTLHNKYWQHYNKFCRQTKEFNKCTSAIIFPQILKFMSDKNFINGKFLTQIIENDIIDLEEIEEESKIIINWGALNKLSDEYPLKPEQEGTIVDDDKTILQFKDKLELTLAIAKMLF